MIRLFAAISVPGDIAEGLAIHQAGLPGARWRDAESLHITLRFFGEVAEPVAEDLALALAGAGAGPFDLTLMGAGAFGEGGKVRAVWAGVEPSEPLSHLARACETAARRVGLAPETRKYAPHVTLAYLRRPAAADVAAWIADHNLLHSPAFRAARFGLYSSWPGEGGSRYELERFYPLV